MFVWGVGEFIDVVFKEMYMFVDCGDCLVMLWFEGIVGVVCVVIEYGLDCGVLLVKLCYVGLFFCYECL